MPGAVADDWAVMCHSRPSFGGEVPAIHVRNGCTHVPNVYGPDVCNYYMDGLGFDPLVLLNAVISLNGIGGFVLLFLAVSIGNQLQGCGGLRHLPGRTCFDQVK